MLIQGKQQQVNQIMLYLTQKMSGVNILISCISSIKKKLKSSTDTLR